MHVVVLHAAADAGAAGSVAAVLGDLTAYTVEVGPNKTPLRFGPHVVPVFIWSPQSGGPDIVEAFVQTLDRTAGRGIVFNFSGATLPEAMRTRAVAVLDQTNDGEGDQARLRDAITGVAPPTPATSLQRTTTDPTTAMRENRRPGGFLLGLLVGCALGVGGANLAERYNVAPIDIDAAVQAPQMPDGYHRQQAAESQAEELAAAVEPGPTAQPVAAGSPEPPQLRPRQQFRPQPQAPAASAASPEAPQPAEAAAAPEEPAADPVDAPAPASTEVAPVAPSDPT